MNSQHPNSSEPKVNESLSQLRHLIQRYLSLRGLTMVGIFVISFFWLAGLIDYFPVWLGAQDSPIWVRGGFLLLGLLSLGALAWKFVIHPLNAYWTDRALALLIERRYPQLNGVLVTHVENRDLDSQRAKSSLTKHWSLETNPQLQSQVARTAESAMEAIDVYDVLEWNPLRLQFGALGAMLAISLLAFFAVPDWTSLWGKRLFLLSNEAWPRQSSITADYIEIAIPNFTGETERTFYKIPFADKVATLPLGQSARLYASASLDARLVPTYFTMNYRTADGQSGRANLRRLPENRRARRQPFMLDGAPFEKVKQSLVLSLRGGDARVSDLQVQTLPAIAFADVQLQTKYPEYLRRRETSTYLDGPQPYRNGLRLPEGTDVTVQLTANRELSRCEYRLISQASNDQQADVGELAVTGNSFSLPLGALRQNLLLEIRAWDVAGHSATEISQYVLSVMEDQPPTAELTLDGVGTSVTPLARLPMRITARDDHDVQEVRSRLVIGDREPRMQTVTYDPASGDMLHEIDLRDLRDQMKIEATPGEVIVLAAEVEDFYDLAKAPHLATSNAIPLTVVTADQLLILLDRRELDLRNRLEQIIIELNQLETMMAKNLESSTAVISPEEADESNNQPASGTDRMRLVRTQEAKIQVEKSMGELQGIAVQIASLNAELQNNRIDSRDRQIRLEEKIKLPIQAVLDTELKQLLAEVQATELDLRDNAFQAAKVTKSLELNAQAIFKLNEVLKSMLDIQDFNEVLDMLREIIDKQEELTEKTKEEQKKRALDLFK